MQLTVYDIQDGVKLKTNYMNAQVRIFYFHDGLIVTIVNGIPVSSTLKAR